VGKLPRNNERGIEVLLLKVTAPLGGTHAFAVFERPGVLRLLQRLHDSG
jgi:hypothetical protein